MKIDNIEQAEYILRQYVDNASRYLGDGMSLERMWPILEAVDNPHTKLKAIHVAGTSGKTSTAYYLSNILSCYDQKIGLTVSPHVDSITERIQINNKPISEEDFCLKLGEFLDKISHINNPSYFELMITFIYWVFVEEKVDYAVIETGLGGMYDSTNVLTRQDKICVITDIGLDHVNILGSTIREIASQKAGIIHGNNQVFMYKQNKDVMDQITKRAKLKSAKLNIVEDDYKIESKLSLFQNRNFNLAKSSIEYLAKRDNLHKIKNIHPDEIIIPGRMEELKLEDGSTLIMDGAHNQQKVKKFVESFNKKYPNTKASILLALKEGKEYQEVLDLLSPIANNFILTTFSAYQDTPVISQNPEIFKKYIEKQKIDSVIIEDNKHAIEELLKNNTEVKIIIGSFYLLGQIRKFIL